MKKVRRNLLLSIFIILPIILTNISPTSANFSVGINITDAYYADLDADNFEDDIFISIDVTLSNIYIETDVDIYIGVTLPSGIEFWFVAKITVIKSTYSYNFGINFDLLNTALESGWYTAQAVGFAEGDQYSIMQSLIFDPPGSNEGSSDPDGYFSIV